MKKEGKLFAIITFILIVSLLINIGFVSAVDKNQEDKQTGFLNILKNIFSFNWLFEIPFDDFIFEPEEEPPEDYLGEDLCMFLDCEDWDDCTTDGCDVDTGECVNEYIEGCDDGVVDEPPVECADGSECGDDGDPCTVAVCNENQCVHEYDSAIPGCVEEPFPGCTSDEECNVDYDPCTTGSCIDGECIYEDIAGCDDGTPDEPPAEECTDHDQCDDGDPCTDDSCDEGVCSHQEIDCPSSSPCQIGICNSETGGCEYQPVDCDDGDLCTHDECDEEGNCVNPPMLCGDSDACTNDYCDNGNCFNDIIEDCEDCTSSTADDCDDDDPCTDDVCDSETGECEHPILNCNDDIRCTDDWCNSGIGCVHVPFSCECNEENPCPEITCYEVSCESEECVYTFIPGCVPPTEPPSTPPEIPPTEPPPTEPPPEECEYPCFETTGSCPSGSEEETEENIISVFFDFVFGFFFGVFGEGEDDEKCCCPEPDCEENSDCNDGNSCNGNEFCYEGECRDSVEKDCDDDDICTIDSCNSETGGCEHTNIGGACAEDCADDPSICEDGVSDPPPGSSAPDPDPCIDLVCTEVIVSEGDPSKNYHACLPECTDGVCGTGSEVCSDICYISSCSLGGDINCQDCSCGGSGSSSGSGGSGLTPVTPPSNPIGFFKQIFGGEDTNIKTIKKYKTSCVSDPSSPHYNEIKISGKKYTIKKLTDAEGNSYWVIESINNLRDIYKKPNGCQKCGSYDFRKEYIYDFSEKGLPSETNKIIIPDDFDRNGEIEIRNYDQIEHPVEVIVEVLDGRGDVVPKFKYNDILEVSIESNLRNKNNLYTDRSDGKLKKKYFPRYSGDYNNIIGIIEGVEYNSNLNNFVSNKINYKVILKGLETRFDFGLCGTHYVKISVAYPGMMYVRLLTIHKDSLIEQYLEGESGSAYEIPVLHEAIPREPLPNGYAGSSNILFYPCSPDFSVDTNDCKIDSYACKFGKCRHLCEKISLPISPTGPTELFPAIETTYDFNRLFLSTKTQLITEFKQLNKYDEYESKLIRDSTDAFVSASCIAVNSMSGEMIDAIDEIYAGDTQMLMDHTREALPLVWKPLFDLVVGGERIFDLGSVPGYAGKDNFKGKIFIQLVKVFDDNSMRINKLSGALISHETAHLLHHKKCSFLNLGNIFGCNFNRNWRSTFKPPTSGHIYYSFDNPPIPNFINGKGNQHVCDKAQHANTINDDLLYRILTDPTTNPPGYGVYPEVIVHPKYGLLRPYGGTNILEDVAVYVEGISFPGHDWGYESNYPNDLIDWEDILKLGKRSEISELFDLNEDGAFDERDDIFDAKNVYYKKMKLLYDSRFITLEQADCILRNSNIPGSIADPIHYP